MDDNLSLPVSIKKHLSVKDVDYECLFTQPAEEGSNHIPDPKPQPSERIKSVLLQDAIGKVQVLIAHDQLIDLTFICESLGRNLHALDPEEADKLASSFGLKSIPAIPLMMGYATIIEASLLPKPTLFLEAGVDDVFIKVTSEEFKKITPGAEITSCGRAFTAHTPTTDSDDSSIQNAVEEFTTLRIKQRLEATLEIPPMPETAKKIIKLRVDPDAGVGELAQLVETDPSLAAQVVSWASSPYYAAPGKITSVHDAVVRVLGFDLVINLALGLALGKTLSLPSDNANGSLPYWQQAVISATACEAIVKMLPKEGRPSAGLCYLAGLLHNFGFLVLGHVFPPYLALINRYIEANNHVAHDRIENTLLGITREQICAWLMNSWSLPEEVVIALKYQRFPGYQGKLHLYPNVLFLANQIISDLSPGAGPKQEIPDSLLKNLGIDRNKTEEACEKVVDQLSELQKLADNFESNT